MGFETWMLNDAGIRLIDGDRGKNYPKQLNFSNSGYCLFLSAKNVTSSGFKFEDPIFIDKKRHELLRAGTLERGDIVMTTRGTIGNVALYDGTVVYPTVRINSGMMIFRPDPQLWNCRFLYYVLTSDIMQQQINNLTSGSAVPQLPARDLRKFELPRVPIKTQNEIEEVISSISDKLKNNQEVNQTLEQMAQAIFKSWFVDFEPVKAKIAALEAGGSDDDALVAAMQAISGKNFEQLTTMQAEQPERHAELRATAELFPSTMQDSELGEIPEGWEVNEIGNEVTVVGGGTPSTKNEDFWKGGDIPWTTPKDLSNLTDKVLIDTVRKITEAGLAKISSGLLPVDTVLMSSRAPVGYLALAKVPVAVNQGYIAMKCERVLTPEYVIHWCNSRMDEIKGRASGTTFAEISKKNFKVIQVLVPPKLVLETFSARVRNIYCEIEALVRQNNTLGEMRDSLLPKLLSGEISVFDDFNEPKEHEVPEYV